MKRLLIVLGCSLHTAPSILPPASCSSWFCEQLFLVMAGSGGNFLRMLGTEGSVTVSRKEITSEPASLVDTKIKPDEIHLLQNTHHYRDFLDCVRTRRSPVTDIDSAVQSDFMSHLGDIAIRTGRTIRWDPVKETIAGDPQAERMMTGAMRGPWRL